MGFLRILLFKICPIPGHAFLDAVDVVIDITSEHKADDKYRIVSAVSIPAKVERDAFVKKIGENEGVEIGSGYPADPKTITIS